LKPKPLRPGARIGVVAPSSAPLSPSLLSEGIRTLQARGFDVVPGRSALEPEGYLSGTDDARLAEINRFLQDPDIDALFCVRGGYGLLRILDRIDYDAMRARPTLIVGYSDVTALHLAVFARTGIPGISGPMVAVEWPEPHAASEALFSDLAGGAMPDPLLGPNGEALDPVRDGTVEGTLLGGNLTLVARLVGTPYLPDLTGAILFLEEIGEAPYRIDGLLAHLHLAGHLERLGGLIYGGFTECEPEAGKPSLSLEAVLDHYAQYVPGPVASGLAYGHFPEKAALPIGVQARLRISAGRAELSILEPVVG
jgi:muramoyltetrapeptide carboxypeptidase